MAEKSHTGDAFKEGASCLKGCRGPTCQAYILILKTIYLCTMTDWKGNEILEGMTIMRVTTKPFANNIQMMWSIRTEDGRSEWQKIGEPIHTPEHIWEVQFESLVESRRTLMPDKSYKDILYYSLKMGDMTYYFELSMIEMSQPSDITCIKGISDNEQEYYLKYFS